MGSSANSTSWLFTSQYIEFLSLWVGFYLASTVQALFNTIVGRLGLQVFEAFPECLVAPQISDLLA